jgi:hypothetical protein
VVELVYPQTTPPPESITIVVSDIVPPLIFEFSMDTVCRAAFIIEPAVMAGLLIDTPVS